MLYFNNDYNENCHPAVMEQLQAVTGQQFPGYGVDACCENAKSLIRKKCANENAQVHFLVGGTQTNLTVIAAALRPHQAVIAADSGHISVHETGAIEATGHKVIALPGKDGKLSPQQVAAFMSNQDGAEPEHMVQPKLVYISHPTEFGTLYSRAELEQLRTVCDNYGLYLFLDGARLGYGLTARGTDVTLEDLGSLCDAFYIGGTKCGAMFGEAVVLTHSQIAQDFRFLIKQKGGMLAKGWLLGAQFEALLKNDLYESICRHANAMADQIRQTLAKCNVPLFVDTVTNQVFPVLPDKVLEKLSANFVYAFWEKYDDTHSVVRFCTSWATKEENVNALCAALESHCLGSPCRGDH